MPHEVHKPCLTVTAKIGHGDDAYEEDGLSELAARFLQEVLTGLLEGTAVSCHGFDIGLATFAADKDPNAVIPDTMGPIRDVKVFLVFDERAAKAISIALDMILTARKREG